MSSSSSPGSSGNVCPGLSGSAPWSKRSAAALSCTLGALVDIDIMESVLDEAARDAEDSKVRVDGLKSRIEDCLLQKDAILHESVDIAADMQQDKEPNDNQHSEKLEKSTSGSILMYSDLQQNKDDIDGTKQLAISLSNATYSGSKATVLALKTIFQAAYTKEVGQAVEFAETVTSQLNFGRNETFNESVRAALDSIVDTTKVFLKMACASDSTREAGESMKNVANELIFAVNAVSVLGTRAFQKFANQKN
jgi:hypothetical protein